MIELALTIIVLWVAIHVGLSLFGFLLLLIGAAWENRTKRPRDIRRKAGLQ